MAKPRNDGGGAWAHGSLITPAPYPEHDVVQLVTDALALALEVNEALQDHVDVDVGAWRRRRNYLERARATARCRSGPSLSFVVAALPLV